MEEGGRQLPTCTEQAADETARRKPEINTGRRSLLLDWRLPALHVHAVLVMGQDLLGSAVREYVLPAASLVTVAASGAFVWLNPWMLSP